MEKDVWNRVTAGREGPREQGLKALAARSQVLLNAYRALAREPGVRDRALAEELAKQEAQTLAALRGLGVLAGQPAPEGALPGPRVRQLARWCWKENLELLAEYTARSAQPGAGVVFRRLCTAGEAQAERIARLMRD